MTEILISNFLCSTQNTKMGSKQRYGCSSDLRDDSPGKYSFNATESSSLSEAWDNYQVRCFLKTLNI